MILHFSPPSAASGHVELPLNPPPHNLPPSFPTQEQLMVVYLLSHIMISLSFQTADPLSSQIAWPKLHVAHYGPVRSWERQEEYSGAEYKGPFREESCRSSCISNSPLHSYSCDAVSQHPSTRAGAESIQLIYSGRALQALSDLARQFWCQPIFWRILVLAFLAPPTFHWNFERITLQIPPFKGE